MKKNRIVTALMGLFLSSASLHATQVDAWLTGGGVMPRLKNTSSVWVYPNWLNQYIAQKQTSTGLMWGGGIGLRATALAKRPLEAIVGVAGYAVDFRHIIGVKQLLVNQGTFDSSLYSFSNNSHLALAEGRLFYTGADWQPFVLAGLGLANNQSRFYREVALGNSVANQNFSNGSHHAFAYEAGFGLRHSLFTDKNGVQVALALDYRYLNAGRTHLGPFAGQTTSQRLHVAHLQSDALLLTLNASV